MSRELTPFNRGLKRTPRQAARAMAELNARHELRASQIEAAADIQALKVDAVAYVGKRAMFNVAMLSQLEVQLATLVPLATSRLQAIGDITSLAIAEVVSDTLRRLG